MQRSLSALALVLVLTASHAHAQPDTTPEQAPAEALESLLARAEDALARQEFDEARALFTQADEVASSARARAGIGLAAFGAGDDIGAYVALTSALAERRSPLRGDARVRATAVREHVTGSIGRVRLNAQRRDAEITVDGEAATIVNGVILVRPGDHRITVSAPGFELASHETEVSAGGEVRVRITPRRLPSAWARADGETIAILLGRSQPESEGGLGLFATGTGVGQGTGTGLIGTGSLGSSATTQLTAVRLRGDPRIEGPIGTFVVHRVMRANVNALRFCADSTSRARRDGAVSVTFEIDASGNTSGGRVLTSSLDGPDVGACIVRQVGRMRFPSEADRDPVRVTVELVVDYNP